MSTAKAARAKRPATQGARRVKMPPKDPVSVRHTMVLHLSFDRGLTREQAWAELGTVLARGGATRDA